MHRKSSRSPADYITSQLCAERAFSATRLAKEVDLGPDAGDVSKLCIGFDAKDR